MTAEFPAAALQPVAVHDPVVIVAPTEDARTGVGKLVTDEDVAAMAGPVEGCELAAGIRPDLPRFIQCENVAIDGRDHSALPQATALDHHALPADTDLVILVGDRDRIRPGGADLEDLLRTAAVPEQALRIRIPAQLE